MEISRGMLSGLPKSGFTMIHPIFEESGWDTMGTGIEKKRITAMTRARQKNFFHVKHLLQGTTQVAVWQDFICHFIIPWPHRGRKGDMDHEKWILGDSVICPVLRL